MLKITSNITYGRTPRSGRGFGAALARDTFRQSVGGNAGLQQIISVEQEIYNIKASWLYDAITLVEQKKKDGLLPEDPDGTLITLEQGGRVRKRDLSTIRPSRLVIGSPARPTVIRAIRKNSDDRAAREAVRIVWRTLQTRSPKWRGEYRDSFVITLNERQISFNQVLIIRTQPGDIFRIWNLADYASALEVGFYNNYYRGSRTSTRRGNIVKPFVKGIMYYAAMLATNALGDEISIRYRYSFGGARDQGGSGYAQPMIEIGTAGLFPSNLSRPKKGKRNFKNKPKSRRRRKTT